ncbi:ribosome-inactivating family protein [Streptomyces sp. NPDC001568]|uniref:ribosome-inactivating family protein n=1 Tax=Streptomyces sp. NPDC001568 TaxID=3364588 RepID=UPI003675EE30
MNPICAIRRAGRRLGTVFLAFLATCALVTVGATPAHAETSKQYTVLDWYVYGLDTGNGGDMGADRAVRYRDFIAQLRAAAGHRMDGANGDDMRDTPTRTNTNRVIEARVWTNENGGAPRSHLKLYFSVDNLYLLGFTSRGQHWMFQPDTNPAFPLAGEVQRGQGLEHAPLFQSLGYRGNYDSLDPHGFRRDFSYTAASMHMTMQFLNNFTAANRPSAPSELAYLIGATSEAARFGWIEHRIAAALNRGYDDTDPNRPSHLGNFGLTLQTQWAALSRVAHRTVNGGTVAPVNIDGRTYDNFTQIRLGTGGVPRLAPFLALHGSR